ncbi:hypothetical protein GCM10010211_78030 [Streptomyces albospinus]|uniref:Transposase n=1 Tax=Streptomyces albospinus TaxID=285515 RepID=A0ABQ2VP76_9ACTN|nr:hypothetical protein GCM10010211_78030 [Streptomyces albospinus]
MKKRFGSSPCVRVEGGGRGVISQAGAVLSTEMVRKSGPDQAISAALAPWRKPRSSRPRSRKTLLDDALDGDRPADVDMLLFGPVASHPTVSRLTDTLAAGGKRDLTAFRTVCAEARERIWKLADVPAPDAEGQVAVDLGDGVLVVAHVKGGPDRDGGPMGVVHRHRVGILPLPGTQLSRRGLTGRCPVLAPLSSVAKADRTEHL